MSKSMAQMKNNYLRDDIIYIIDRNLVDMSDSHDN